MRARDLRRCLFGFLLAAVAGSAVASGSSSGLPGLRNVRFEPDGDGLTVVLETSVSAPRFVCLWPHDAKREVVVRLPDLNGPAGGPYTSGSPLLKDVHVEAKEGAKELLVRLVLGDATLESVEQSEHAISVRLRSAPAAAPPGGPPALSEYRVGSGDKLEITVFGHDDMTKVVEVRGDGSINLPFIGSLQVAGKSVAEIDDEITKILAKDYLVDPEVSVDVRDYQSQWVTIIGEVRTPGRYVLKRDMRLIDLLAEAGGATKDAGAEMLITRSRGDGSPSEPLTVDLGLLLSRNNQASNILLRHGDIITIGEKQVFYIRGEVTRPGSFFLESGLSVMKAISVAGGLSQFANRREIQLLRTGAKGVQEKRVINLKAIEDGKKEDILLMPNDVIIVPRRVF